MLCVYMSVNKIIDSYHKQKKKKFQASDLKKNQNQTMCHAVRISNITTSVYLVTRKKNSFTSLHNL